MIPTVLIVDDEPAIVQVIYDRLTREGFSTLEAGSGAAALASVCQGQPDLVILALQFKQDKQELAQQLPGEATTSLADSDSALGSPAHSV